MRAKRTQHFYLLFFLPILLLVGGCSHVATPTPPKIDLTGIEATLAQIQSDQQTTNAQLTSLVTLAERNADELQQAEEERHDAIEQLVALSTEIDSISRQLNLLQIAINELSASKSTVLPSNAEILVKLGELELKITELNRLFPQLEAKIEERSAEKFMEAWHQKNP